MKTLQIISSISEAHLTFSVAKSKNPLISILKLEDINFNQFEKGIRARVELFQIWMIEGIDCQLGYGRNSYDFTEGALAFLKPGQVLSSVDNDETTQSKGFLILFHPDLIRKANLSKIMDSYSFFEYESREALYISEAEKSTLTEIISKINFEINQNIDRHSQYLINSNLELFLGYCQRFYDRQFYSRANHNQDVVTKLQSFLSDYYLFGKANETGVPTVALCAEHLNMSPSYLSDLLRKEIGKNSHDFIQDFIMNRAKNLLLGTSESLSQIGYSLGYLYPQHFTKVFKRATGISPSVYRQVN